MRTLAEFEAWLKAVEERKRQIRMLYIEGKSQNHIARLLGISQPAVRKHLIRMGLHGKKFAEIDTQKGEDIHIEKLIEKLRCMNPNFGPRYYSDVLQFIPTIGEMQGLTKLYEEEEKKAFMGKASQLSSAITNLCCSLNNLQTVLNEVGKT
ncbi:MAG: hypothetical protein ACUVUQ_10895 [Thermodesulfovibrionales bacterium]